jgi:hypothetical protein
MPTPLEWVLHDHDFNGSSGAIAHPDEHLGSAAERATHVSVKAAELVSNMIRNL